MGRGHGQWERRKISNYIDIFYMSLLRRKANIKMLDRVRNEKVRRRLREERNIFQKIKNREASWKGRTVRRDIWLMAEWKDQEIECWMMNWRRRSWDLSIDISTRRDEVFLWNLYEKKCIKWMVQYFSEICQSHNKITQ